MAPDKDRNTKPRKEFQPARAAKAAGRARPSKAPLRRQGDAIESTAAALEGRRDETSGWCYAPPPREDRAG